MEVLRKISAYLIYSSSLSTDEISGFWDINLIVEKNNTIISNRLAILEFLDFFGEGFIGILDFTRNFRFTLGILDFW